MAGSKQIHLQTLNHKDQMYEDRDLKFAKPEGRSLLQYGNAHTAATDKPQKLLAMTRSGQRDLHINSAKPRPERWRTQLLEPLSLIGPHNLLRRPGNCSQQQPIHQLPPIAAIRQQVPPLPNSHSRMCEQSSYPQRARLHVDAREQALRQLAGNPQRISDAPYREIFGLHRLNRKTIQLRDITAADNEVQPLDAQTKTTVLHAQPTSHNDATMSNTPEPDATATAALEAKPKKPDHQQSNCPTQRDALNLRRQNPGIGLIINLQKFHRNVNRNNTNNPSPEPPRRRDGTQVDQERLNDAFPTMGKNVQPYDKVEHLAIKEGKRCACHRTLLPVSREVNILSHGIQDAIYPWNNTARKITDIEDIIDSCDGSAMQGKSMVEAQACQGKSVEFGPENSLDRIIYIPSDADFLIAMSTFESFVSMRNTGKGSWFIGSPSDPIERRSTNEPNAHIQTIVRNEVTPKRASNHKSKEPIVEREVNIPSVL
uniref:Procaspase-8 n=1 Tax=Nilaparvata lugens TaxID=108931 RepID=B6ETS5_NILLU|nr:procaspase-8 [Nilaparvata lugens]